MRDWENCYRIGEMPWDKGSPAPPLLELIERRGRSLWGDGRVMVPGCGLGHDVRALAAIGVPALGVDIAETATSLACGIETVDGEIYETGDFLSAEWSAGRRFSAVWEHTCFCAIDPGLRAAYAEAVAAVLDEGGIFAGVFYLTPDSEEGPPFGVSVDELERLFSPNFERIDGWVPQQAYAGREGREWIGIFRRHPHARVAGQTGCR